jgi:predicted nucleic acid-binding protein
VTFSATPTPVVVDASVAVGAATGEQPAISAMQEWAASAAVLLAPPLFWSETANALTRGKRMGAGDVAGMLRALRRTRIEVADRGFEGLEAAMVLAERHRLSVYDATYLWLAIDVDGELATFDRALANAAEAEGVPLAIELPAA